MTQVIARGIFAWDVTERLSDRYGAVGLFPTDYNETTTTVVELDRLALQCLNGRRVTMVATVLETRESGYMGDVARRIYPTMPVVGERIELGTGTFFTMSIENVDALWDWSVFGLQPDDGRLHDWFDPEKLYRLYDQTVELMFNTVD